VRPLQPEIHLHVVRFDAATPVQSMVKYIEISNVLRAVDSSLLVAPTRRTSETLAAHLDQYLIFIADNALLVEVNAASETRIRINRIAVQVATIFFNEAISFIPCFKYADSEDVILFTSRNIHYLVDKAGQFNENYYGMKHELIELITMWQQGERRIAVPLKRIEELIDEGVLEPDALLIHGDYEHYRYDGGDD
jgi:hypothetical protein